MLKNLPKNQIDVACSIQTLSLAFWYKLDLIFSYMIQRGLEGAVTGFKVYDRYK